MSSVPSEYDFFSFMKNVQISTYLSAYFIIWWKEAESLLWNASDYIHYNIIACVSMTSPCSLNRSKIGKMGLKLWKWSKLREHDPSAPWLRPWCYDSCI